MQVNFDITDNYALNFEGVHIDLHNNFDFVSFDYQVTTRDLKLHWIRSTGDWVPDTEFSKLILTHKMVTYLAISDAEENAPFLNHKHLTEITYFSSKSRDINDGIWLQSRPNSDDDILYFFENGQLIRIHCEQIILECFLE